MTKRVEPLIHVPDVRATVDWYTSIGFTLTDCNEIDGEMDWASLAFGDSRIMFDEGGLPSSADRREVDLYIQTDDVEALYERLKDRVKLREDIHDTFYGAREFIICDLNGFWITFGQTIDKA